MEYRSMNQEQLQAEHAAVEKEFEALKAKGLKLDMSRGKPGKARKNARWFHIGRLSKGETHAEIVKESMIKPNMVSRGLKVDWKVYRVLPSSRAVIRPERITCPLSWV